MYKIWKNTFLISEATSSPGPLEIPVGQHRFVKFLDAKPTPSSAHHIDVWFVVEAPKEAFGPTNPAGLLLVEGTGWPFNPRAKTKHFATVRTPADYVWHLFEVTETLSFEESGL